MKSNILTLRCSSRQTVLAMLCAIAIGPGDALAAVWVPPQAGVQVPESTARPLASGQVVASPLSADRLDSLVAPIALYPDPLLAQTLAAATYPAEIEELSEFLGNNPGLQGQALANAVSMQPWDPSVQSMAAFPDVVMMMADNSDWTTDLGDAFIGQESAVMDAVQRMRQKAEATGNLRTTDQQVVKKIVVENHPVIVIEPANPQVVYVPTYNPAMVFGPPVYPFPVFVGPPRVGLGLAFGAGIGMGAFWGVGGGWGWSPGWGRRNSIMINHNNFFVRNSGFYRNRNTWAHNGGRRRNAAVGTTGRRGTGTGRRNPNRVTGTTGSTGRRNPNRVEGTTGRGNANRSGNVGAWPGAASRNRNATRNRPTGTSGRSQSRQNRGQSVNRPTGTSGRSGGSRANRSGGGGGNRGNANRGNRGGGGGGRRGGR